MKNNFKLVALGFGLFVPFFFSVISVAADFEFQDLDPLPIEDMRVQIYTQEFADRFNLPVDGISADLSNGIQALDYKVQKFFHPEANYYSSSIRVYVDDSLPIAYPSDSRVGYRFDHDMEAHFFSYQNIPNWRDEEDATYYVSFQRGFYSGVFIGSEDYVVNEKGFRFSMPINRFERQVVPGISFLEIAYGNLTLSFLEANELQDIELWIKKEGSDVTNSNTDNNPLSFLKTPLPQEFLATIIPFDDAVLERYRLLTLRRRNR